MVDERDLDYDQVDPYSEDGQTRKGLPKILFVLPGLAFFVTALFILAD